MSIHRIFKTRYFHRWMNKTDLTDNELIDAVLEMKRGLIDVKLGGNIVKKRIAISGRGKRGGARTIVATNFGNHWFFLYGFEKNDRANITDNELEALKEIGNDLLSLDNSALVNAIEKEKLIEVKYGN